VNADSLFRRPVNTGLKPKKKVICTSKENEQQGHKATPKTLPSGK
jgi:hypothetical protein